MDLEPRLIELVKQIQNLARACYPDFSFRIGYLTIFAQDVDDYSRTRSQLDILGTAMPANNGEKFLLKEPLLLLYEKIGQIRIRKPDVHRPELGCADLIYDPKDYSLFKELALTKGFDIIQRQDYEMIELANFSLPVYAYLVSDTTP